MCKLYSEHKSVSCSSSHLYRSEREDSTAVRRVSKTNPVTLSLTHTLGETFTFRQRTVRLDERERLGVYEKVNGVCQNLQKSQCTVLLTPEPIIK